MINDRMDVNEWLRKQLGAAEPDLLREMVQTFAETLMSADAEGSLRPSASVQQPVWEIAALTQLRDLQIDRADPSVPTTSPIPIPPVDPIRAHHPIRSAAHLVLTLTWLETSVIVANKLAIHAYEEMTALLHQFNGSIVQNGRTAGFKQDLRKVAEVVVPRGYAVVGNP